ncbi:Sentrin-specific protease 1 [Armadillidium nasatum]|uniref:Sentrin-specific protease 1 n=1 Tax=Armadillidium nasatum TaxID=96803 RepID=A0A5N5SWD8_9CRUS|nr:Sentrin-specific protease 1 [Armadillidium nasatum]
MNLELGKYLESEHQDKKKKSYDISSFSAENVKNSDSDSTKGFQSDSSSESDSENFSVNDIPQQMNGSDCGMFSCKFAEYLSRNAPITFTQEHMPYFRRRMVYEIVTQKLIEYFTFDPKCYDHHIFLHYINI